MLLYKIDAREIYKIYYTIYFPNYYKPNHFFLKKTFYYPNRVLAK